MTKVTLKKTYGEKLKKDICQYCFVPQELLLAIYNKEESGFRRTKDGVITRGLSLEIDRRKPNI